MNVYDTVAEGANAGIDTVVVTALDNPDTFSSVETYTLGANIENGIDRRHARVQPHRQCAQQPAARQ